MPPTIPYTFSAELWQYPGKGGWWFVSLPSSMSQEIRGTMQRLEGGWGRLGVAARIGRTQWETAIWFDTKRGTYLLPVKAAVRATEHLAIGAVLHVTIWL